MCESSVHLCRWVLLWIVPHRHWHWFLMSRAVSFFFFCNTLLVRKSSRLEKEKLLSWFLCLRSMRLSCVSFFWYKCSRLIINSRISLRVCACAFFRFYFRSLSNTLFAAVSYVHLNYQLCNFFLIAFIIILAKMIFTQCKYLFCT